MLLNPLGSIIELRQHVESEATSDMAPRLFDT